jgi:hypothetical protein
MHDKRQLTYNHSMRQHVYWRSARYYDYYTRSKRYITHIQFTSKIDKSCVPHIAMEYTTAILRDHITEKAHVCSLCKYDWMTCMTYSAEQQPNLVSTGWVRTVAKAPNPQRKQGKWRFHWSKWNAYCGSRFRYYYGDRLNRSSIHKSRAKLKWLYMSHADSDSANIGVILILTRPKQCPY